MGSFLAVTTSALLLVFLFQHSSIPKTAPPAPASQVQSGDHPVEPHLQIPADHPTSVVGSAQESRSAGSPQTPKADFGWLSFIAKPLYLALRFLHEHGIGNWGWAIIVSTAIFNLLTFWPRVMSMKSSLRMMRVQPKVDALKKRYAQINMNESKRGEMNAELMALYKADGANLYGGCLPMLLPMPLLLGYFRVLQNAVELHGAHWFWLTDLSSPDPLHILPIVIIVTMFLTQLVTPSPGMDRTQRRMLAFVMPILMGFTLWRYASGLGLYWATGNIINLSIQLVINRTRLGKEMHAIAANRAGKRIDEQ